MKARNSAEEENRSPAWMATFADLATLLLTFFVLLLSFAEMDIIKFKDALGSIQEAFGITKGGSRVFKGSPSPINFDKPLELCSTKPASSPASKATDSEIVNELQHHIDTKGLRTDVEVSNSEKGVVLRVRGRFFFTPGTAELKAESHETMSKIAYLMRKFPRKIAIEGHTDNIPLRGRKFTNNWDLSTARAYASLKYLQEREELKVDRIHIAGFADTRPIASNDTPEGRSKNRRVEFVFYEP